MWSKIIDNTDNQLIQDISPGTESIRNSLLNRLQKAFIKIFRQLINPQYIF